jgi:hypothetical protein
LKLGHYAKGNLKTSSKGILMVNKHQEKLIRASQLQQVPKCVVCKKPTELIRVHRDEPPKKGMKGKPFFFEWKCLQCEMHKSERNRVDFLHTFLLMK